MEFINVKDDVGSSTEKDSANQNFKDNISCDVSCDIKAPLSPVLSVGKRNMKLRKLRIQMSNKNSQSYSQEFCTEKDEIANVNESSEVNSKSSNSDLKERIMRFKDIQRNRKFCYNIAVKSSSDSDLNAINSATEQKCDFLTCRNTSKNFNFKIPESPMSCRQEKCGAVAGQLKDNRSDENLALKTAPKPCKLFDNSLDLTEEPESLYCRKINCGVGNVEDNKFDVNFLTKMRGFQTGDGKKIQLSERAIQRATKLFDDILDFPSNSQTSDAVNCEKTETVVKNNSDNTEEKCENNNDTFKTVNATSVMSSAHHQKKSSDLNSCNKQCTQQCSRYEYTRNVQERISVDNLKEANRNMLSVKKSPLATQISDTQIVLAVENAENLAEFMDTQWIPSPAKNKQKTTKKINDLRRESEEFEELYSQETNLILGDITINLNGPNLTSENEYEDVGISNNSDEKGQNSCRYSVEDVSSSVKLPLGINNFSFEDSINSEKISQLVSGRFTSQDDLSRISVPKEYSSELNSCGFVAESFLCSFKIPSSVNFCGVSHEASSKSQKLSDINVGLSCKDVSSSIEMLSDSSFRPVQNLSESQRVVDLNSDGYGSSSKLPSEISCIFPAQDFVQSQKVTDVNYGEDTPSRKIPEKNPSCKSLQNIPQLHSREFSDEFSSAVEPQSEVSPNSFSGRNSVNTQQLPGISVSKMNSCEISAKDNSSAKSASKKSACFVKDSPESLTESKTKCCKEDSIEVQENSHGFFSKDVSPVKSVSVVNCHKLPIEDSTTSQSISAFNLSKSASETNTCESSVENSTSQKIRELNDGFAAKSDSPPVKPASDINFCGFSVEDSIQSLNISELYKRGIKYTEGDIKKRVFYPISFTFADIQQSIEYKNKNVRYSLRSRSKPVMTASQSVRKSIRIANKKITLTPNTGSGKKIPDVTPIGNQGNSRRKNFTPSSSEKKAIIGSHGRSTRKSADGQNAKENISPKLQSSEFKKNTSCVRTRAMLKYSAAAESKQDVCNIAKDKSHYRVTEKCLLMEKKESGKRTRKVLEEKSPKLEIHKLSSLEILPTKSVEFNKSTTGNSNKDYLKGRGLSETSFSKINTSEETLCRTNRVLNEHFKVYNSGFSEILEKDNEILKQSSKMTENKQIIGLASKTKNDSSISVTEIVMDASCFDDTEDVKEIDFFTKSVSVVKEMSKKTRKMFEDNEHINTSTPKIDRDKSVTVYVPTSEKLLQKTENAFDEDKVQKDAATEKQVLIKTTNLTDFPDGSKYGVPENKTKKSEELLKIADSFKDDITSGFSKAHVTGPKKSVKAVKNIFKDFQDISFVVPTNSMICGFSTASGKKVEIAEESLKKVQNIFANIDDSLDSSIKDEFSKKNITEMGESSKAAMNTKNFLDNKFSATENDSKSEFSTAFAKKIVVIEETSSKVKSVCENTESINELLTTAQEKATTSKELLKTAIYTPNFSTLENNTVCGFSASNNRIVATEKSSKKVNTVFENIGGFSESYIEDELPAAPEEKPATVKHSAEETRNTSKDFLNTNFMTTKIDMMCGFSTASGKNVRVTEESLNRVKNIFHGVEDIFENDNNDGLSNVSSKKTAPVNEFLIIPSKKIVQVKEPLKNTESIFENSGDNADNFKHKILCTSSKDVTIEELQKTVKDIFENIEGDIESNVEDTSYANFKKEVVEPQNKLRNVVKLDEDTSENNVENRFSSVFNKKVTEMDKSLKNCFEDFQGRASKNNMICGFATASGKGVTVTEESLKKVRNIFENMEDINQNEELLATPEEEITITEELLNKKNSVVETNDNIRISTSTSDNILYSATTVEKKVTIDDALKEPEHIFKDIETEPNDTHKNDGNFSRTRDDTNPIKHTEDEHTPYEKKIIQNFGLFQNGAGFSSASGKNINVSEDALMKVKNLFADCETANEEDSSYPTPKNENNNSSINPRSKQEMSKSSLKRPRNIFENFEDFSEDSKRNCSRAEFNDQSTPGRKILKKINYQSGSSPLLTSKILADSPRTSNNQSTPLNKTLGSRSLKKRSLGMSSCRQIDIPNNSVKKARLLFDTKDSKSSSPVNTASKNVSLLDNSRNSSLIDRNAKNVSLINTSRSDSLVNYNSRSVLSISNIQGNSTPVNKNVASSNETPQSRTLLNSNVSIKETNQMLSTPKTCKISPCKLSDEKFPQFVFRERTGDVENCQIGLEKEYEALKFKMAIIETRLQTLKTQQEVIAEDSSHKRPRPGCLFGVKSRNERRISLREAVNNRRPGKNTHQICLRLNISLSLLEITAENASSLHFNIPWSSNVLKFYPAVIRTEDEAVIVPNQHNLIGVPEIETAFLAMPGVDPKLVPSNWVQNHYRWIVWKLASLERNYPDDFREALTVENVVAQLKYRYDREIDRAQRPALRKILECDDTPAKRMVLCVASIIKVTEGKFNLELTDGWYSVRTILDLPLNSLVARNIIKSGMKLMIQGAELLNCEGCPPLEIPANVRLQIHYNSTRRAAWYTKLGVQLNPGPLCVNLRMILGNGGPVGATRVYIARVYPLSFVERCESSSTWRNQRAETRAANQWEIKYSEMMEKLHMKVQLELENEWNCSTKAKRKPKIVIKNISEVSCGRTLYQYLEDSNDPDSVKEMLTEDQLDALQRYQSQVAMEKQSEFSSRLQQKLSNESAERRNVCPVLKQLVVDVNSPCHHKILSIWRPNESHQQELKEGTVVNIFSLTAKYNGILSSSPRTQFCVDSNFDSTKFESMDRRVSEISHTITSDFKPCFGEFDTVGIVVSTDLQSLWLADENFRFLLIKLKERADTCYLFDGLTPGKVVTVMNLVHQKSFKTYGEALANLHTVVSSYPQHSFLQDSMKEFIENLPEDMEKYLEDCKEMIEVHLSQINKQSGSLNVLPSSSQTNTEHLKYLLCGLQNKQKNKCDELTLSDEELSMYDTQSLI